MTDKTAAKKTTTKTTKKAPAAKKAATASSAPAKASAAKKAPAAKKAASVKKAPAAKKAATTKSAPAAKKAVASKKPAASASAKKAAPAKKAVTTAKKASSKAAPATKKAETSAKAATPVKKSTAGKYTAASKKAAAPKKSVAPKKAPEKATASDKKTAVKKTTAAKSAAPKTAAPKAAATAKKEAPAKKAPAKKAPAKKAPAKKSTAKAAEPTAVATPEPVKESVKGASVSYSAVQEPPAHLTLRVDANRVVAFHYRLCEVRQDGSYSPWIESSFGRQPLLYLHGYGNVVAGLEQAMAGKKAGDTLSITLSPEQAYGYRKSNELARLPIKHLHNPPPIKNLVPGVIVGVRTNQGVKNALVVKVGKFNVDVDTNHPYAGRTLHYQIEVLGVRDATPTEIAHRHVHGPGGHQH